MGTELHKATNTALAEIGRLATLGMNQEATLDQLLDVLLNAADAISTFNRARLDALQVPCTLVPPLTNDLSNDLHTMMDFGIQVASRIHAKILNETTNKKQPPGDKAYDVFVSFPGEERFLYMPLLVQKMMERAPSHRPYRIFRDEESLKAGKTADGKAEIFRALIRSHYVLCVCTYHSVQRKWPMAELLCSLWRNQYAVENNKKSFVIIDAMPGVAWHASPSMRNRSIRSWGDDIIMMVPMKQRPQLVMCKEEDGIKHLDKVVGHLFGTSQERGQRSSNFTIDISDKDRGGYYDTDEYHACQMILEASLSRQNLIDLLQDEKECCFAVRMSKSQQLSTTSSSKKKSLAVCAVVGNKGVLLDYLWYFDDRTGKFVWATTGSHETDTRPYNSIGELLHAFGAFDYVAHDDFSADLNEFMTRGAKAARDIEKKRKD